MSTETIDRLFLELSQVTQATTAKELALIAERDALLKQARNATALLISTRSVLRDLSHRVHSGYDFNADPDAMTLRVGRVEEHTEWLKPLASPVVPDVLAVVAERDELREQVAQLREASAVLSEAVRNWTPTDHNGSHGTALDEGLRIAGTALAATAPKEAPDA